MKDIHITPTQQVLAVLALFAALAAVVMAQMPEIQRYLKVRAMD